MKQVIYDSFNIEEFEQQWTYVIKTHDVESDKWLEELFKEITMWAPVHMHDTFIMLSLMVSSIEKPSYVNMLRVIFQQ